MIYRIDIQNFLLHAIDHLEFVDLNYAIYGIISSAITCGMKDLRCSKFNILYPLTETVMRYADTENKDVLEQELMAYYEKLLFKERSPVFYDLFVKPIEEHANVILVCDRCENPYLDVLSAFVKKQFAIEVIDLNKLFEDGHLNPVRYNYSKICDKGKEIREITKREEMLAKASTEDGRMELLQHWNRKTKLALCKELKLRVRKSIDDETLNALLIDAWVREDDD